MAGDWIKMRSELLTHPRFLSLCGTLIYGPECEGFLVYVCGVDALEPEMFPGPVTTVTKRALRCVTERALRAVTLCVTLRVWCAVNSHCKVSGADAIMQPMSLADLDEIAGFPGFGKALSAVGWVREEECNSLRFPNFLEFNEPACLRRAPRTNAERQKAFRDKRRCVTARNESNAREEKRREDKKKTLPPLPPSLDAPEFRKAWDEWIAFRAERKPKVTPLSATRALNQLATWGVDRAIAAIGHSIANGYQGIYEPNGAKSGRAKATFDEMFDGAAGGS